MFSQYMEELEKNPYSVEDFVEKLFWRTNTNCENFDPELLTETFNNTIKDLKILQERQQRKCEKLEAALSEEQKIHARDIEKLLERHSISVECFHNLDEKINSVAGKIIHLGEQLENVNTPRTRTAEALKLLNHMGEFLVQGPVVNDIFTNKANLLEAADIIQKLYLVAQDLPADKFGAAKKKIESKYDEVERNLIEEFARAQTEENIDKMKELAKIMSQFKGYNQCVDVYIEQSQATSYRSGKDVFESIAPLCRQHYGIIKQVFSSPDQVMSKFILNIYQLRIHQFVATKLADDSKDDYKFLKTLHYLYLRTMKLSNDLSEFIKDSNDDLLSKLTQNMFAKHLANYIEIELRCFDSICSMEVKKFYDSKNHQKKQTERFQDLKRDMQAIISARTNINIVQIDNYGGETFLSEELAINLLQESAAAFERCSVLSKEADTPTNIIKIADILLKYLLTEHCDYAVDLGIQSIPIADTKSAPQIYFFDVVQKTNTIVHLLEKTYNASIMPYVISTSKYSDCMHKKRFCMDSIENKLDNGLDRSLNAICNWVKIYLQNEQKKTDFKPETDIDTVASSACSAVCNYINSCIAQIKKTIDGDNLSDVLQELGIRFHRVIYEHLLQYQYNTLGAMVAICDVNEYRKCVRKLGDSLVSQLFDILHALCNLLLVKHENLQEVCNGETLNYLDKTVVLNFIQLRSDFKIIKPLTASLKTY
ncbi:hypothetical protein PVAND_000840 [Polypedilum vanderplanki]|uniref:Exocyst complex component 5 n=1 Tax=Polypedilum vanderplanki TaxID=319348 RepID=A0A9J6BLE9_POLVA|nr:hypothetical protein PVAND_000840 [Polypedilum vanderplanki]